MGAPGHLDAGEPVLLADPVILEIAKAHRKTPAQVLICWATMRNTAAIPKSISPEHLKENIAVFDFTLTAAEMKKIAACDRRYRFVNPSGWWRVPYFD